MSLLKSETSDLFDQIGKALPAAVGAAVTYVTLTQWVAISTVLYVFTQMSYLLWRWSWERKERRAAFDRDERKANAMIAALAREMIRKSDFEQSTSN